MLSLGVSVLADIKTKTTTNKKTIVINLITRIIVRCCTASYSIARLEITSPLNQHKYKEVGFPHGENCRLFLNLYVL